MTILDDIADGLAKYGKKLSEWQAALLENAEPTAPVSTLINKAVVEDLIGDHQRRADHFNRKDLVEFIDARIGIHSRAAHHQHGASDAANPADLIDRVTKLEAISHYHLPYNDTRVEDHLACDQKIHHLTDALERCIKAMTENGVPVGQPYRDLWEVAINIARMALAQ